jgi:hypothetical protein
MEEPACFAQVVIKLLEAADLIAQVMNLSSQRSVLSFKLFDSFV